MTHNASDAPEALHGMGSSQADDNTRQPAMVFHAPYPMDDNPTTASRLRPARMRQAFIDAGYRVFDASGDTPRRRQALIALRKYLRSGGKIDFLYSENSTQPNLLATSVKNGFAPAVDYLIMREATRAGVPVGVFYRDIYWKFPSSSTSSTRQRIIPWLHRLDMFGYQKNKVHFFLPSTRMASIMNLKGNTWSALPPAGDKRVMPPLSSGPLEIIYVGGVGGHYDVSLFIDSLASTDNVTLNLCTSESAWQAYLAHQPHLPLERLKIFHLASEQLSPLYERSHIGMLAMKPDPYREFATPVKLYEYLSYGRPVIATQGTNAATIVEDTGAGWTVEPTSQALTDLLEHLRDNPQEIAEKAALARSAGEANTWLARAELVADTLRKKISE